MSSIRTNAAAGILGVSASTLRGWERRYGFPRPLRSPGGHRLYALADVDALRQALSETGDPSCAVTLAAERGAAPSSASRLAATYEDFDEEAAGRVLEESLAVRSLERTIDELLLSAVEEHHAADAEGPESEFAWRHATGWLSAIKRLAPPATRPEGVLIVDATQPFTIDALHAQALEVLLRRSGLRTLTMRPATDPTRLGRAVRALSPEAVVLAGAGVEAGFSAGSGASLDAIGRLVYIVRSFREGVEIFDFRGAVPDTGASTVARLGVRPLAARDALLARLVTTVSPADRLRHLA